MKKLLLAISLLALAASSCVRERLAPLPQPGKDSVTLTFGIEGSPVTRGVLGETPDIKDIHVAVFGTSGYLQEYNLATINETSFAHEGHTDYSYSVSLPLYDGACTIHFIANGPATIPFGNEATVMASLRSAKGSDREDAYWQYRVLENGITYDEELFNTEGIISLPPDFAEANDLAHIPLVRNFAKLTVRVAPECENFVLTGFTIVNEPMEGSIAPYNTLNSRYVEDFQTYDFAGLKERYPGYIPPDTELDASVPADNAGFEAEMQEEGQFVYFYERPSSPKKPTHIIMRGDYTDGEGTVHYNRFYKINILDGSDPVTFYRNMQYDIVITSVAQIGSETPADAETNITSVDVNSEIFQDIPYYTENNATIYVEYTSATYVQGGVNTLRFRYVKDNVNRNDLVTLEAPDGEVIEPGSISITSRDDGSNDDNLGGWGTITYTVNEPAATTLNQIFTVRGEELTRDVKIILKGPQTMTLALDPPSIMKQVGDTTRLIIGLPTDMNISMFPFQLFIESDKLSISPRNGAKLPVIDGPSIIESKNGENSFRFVRTLSWYTYMDLVEQAQAAGEERVYIEALIKSNIDISECDIYVANRFFNTASVHLYNYDPGHFEPMSLESDYMVYDSYSGEYYLLGGEDRKVTLDFEMDKNATGPVYLTLTGMMLDPDYPDELSDFEVVDGKNVYRYAKSTVAGPKTVHLITTTDMGEVAAEVSSEYFVTSSVSVPRTLLDFGDHGFSTTEERINVGERVLEYYFNYHEILPGEPVIVTVKGGTLATDPRVERIDDDSAGNSRYLFTPSDNDTYQTFNVISSFAQSVSIAKLESASYYPTTPEAGDVKNRKVVVPVASIKVTGSSRVWFLMYYKVFAEEEANETDWKNCSEEWYNWRDRPVAGGYQTGLTAVKTNQNLQYAMEFNIDGDNYTSNSFISVVRQIAVDTNEWWGKLYFSDIPGLVENSKNPLEVPLVWAPAPGSRY